MDLGNVLIVYRTKEKKRLGKILSILKSKNIAYAAVERLKVKTTHVTGKDLVIAFGGDGTFLKAASIIKDSTPILGVDSNPGTREAYYSRANVNTFSQKINKKFKIVSLQRLEVSINGKTLPRLALNEFLITTAKPYHTVLLCLEGNYLKSSGILVGTGSGSSAWIKSAGGKKLPLSSKKFQFVVREPYIGKLHTPQKVKGILEHHKTLHIVACMKSGILVPDSSDDVTYFNKDDKIEIKMSEFPIQFVEV
tara:strand:+ start:1463 stop:2215 length:753 start_codon:yes stop_codon:yes gene_type:complete